MKRVCWLLIIFALAAYIHEDPALRGQETEMQPGEPIEYRPFFPDRWRAKGQSTRLIPWQGENVVFLTTTDDLDSAVMDRFVRRLDAGWAVYAETVGRQPKANREYQGKPIIAAVPNASYTCGIGCGYLGTTGIEVGGFYANDYKLVVGNPDAFPHYYFYEMGRNYFLFDAQIHDFATGFAVFQRYVCMDTVQCEDPDRRTRQVIELAESKLKDTDLTFLQAFTNSAGISEKANRLKDLSPSDQPVMYASAMLKLRRDYGGNAWVTRFFQFLQQCPPAGSGSESAAKAQTLNWLIAASCAARQDLSGLFVDRWRMSLAPRERKVLQTIDWQATDLSPREIIESLAAGE